MNRPSEKRLWRASGKRRVMKGAFSNARATSQKDSVQLQIVNSKLLNLLINHNFTKTKHHLKPLGDKHLWNHASMIPRALWNDGAKQINWKSFWHVFKMSDNANFQQLVATINTLLKWAHARTMDLFGVCEQRGPGRDCACAQSHLGLRSSHSKGSVVKRTKDKFVSLRMNSRIWKIIW